MTSQISKSQYLFRKLPFNLNFSESFVYYQTTLMHFRNELYGIILSRYIHILLTLFKKSKHLSTVDY